jgi:hypothetical protein
MSQVNFNYYNKSTNQESTKREFKVGFFNLLQDDGDEVIVRFPYKSTDEFHLATVHTIKVGKLFRKISCLGNKETCPFCNKGDSYSTRFFCKILAYEKDEKQNIITKSYVWDRPAAFANEIVGALADAVELGLYPSNTKIEDVVFKIKRTGKHGDKATTYKVVPANPNIYKSELYTKEFKDLNDCKIAGLFYMVKTADDINSYLKTGEFPTKTTNSYDAPKSASAVVNSAHSPAVDQDHMSAQNSVKPAVVVSTVPSAPSNTTTNTTNSRFTVPTPADDLSTNKADGTTSRRYRF